MRREEILSNNLEFLYFEDSLKNKLKQININTIEDLWKCKRDYLKEKNFTNDDIYQIKVKLQLIGLDLNKKIY